MKDIPSCAEYTTETLRDLVTQLILKHERTVLEVMRELKQENERLRAENDTFRKRYVTQTAYDAVKAEVERLRAELAAAHPAHPAQEPVATYSPCCRMLREGRQPADVMHDGNCRSRRGGDLGPTLLLYAAPPARQPLTDEQINAAYKGARNAFNLHQRWLHCPLTAADTFNWHFARAVEQAHGIGRQE